MAKILGLDLGTNSIGWAVVEQDRGDFSLIDKGIRIFQEGVKIEKGNESSKAAERTKFRAARRMKFRRKLRKIELLKVLSESGYCPTLSKEEINNWRYKKIYPQNVAFRNWWRTDDETNKHPYSFRNIAVTEKLDLTKEENRFIIGRILYHFAQRRGFLSNRLDQGADTSEMERFKPDLELILEEAVDIKGLADDLQAFFAENETEDKQVKKVFNMISYLKKNKEANIDEEREKILKIINKKESLGPVKQSIAELSEEKGERTLGQLFYERYLKGEKIRTFHTHREDHYLEEFCRIAAFQNLPKEFVDKAIKALFYQRPLKSQKGLIGKCVFEPSKPRCAVSHPAFEEFRMLCFVNTIKIKTAYDDEMRFLSKEERIKITPLFYRKKEHFDFEDIAKQLAPKKQYAFYKNYGVPAEFTLFNFPMNTTVSGCPLSSRFMDLFGENWKNLQVEYQREKDGKLSVIDIQDVWHVLLTFDKDDKLIEFAQKRLNLDEKQILQFLRIRLKQDYASLSLKAIHKMLPYLREGLLYSHAVFLANIEETVPEEIWKVAENKTLIRNEICQIIETQNLEKDIVEIVNGIIKTTKQNHESWSEEASALYKNDIKDAVTKLLQQDKYKKYDFSSWNNLAFALLKTHLTAKTVDYAQVQTIDDRVKTFLTDQFGEENLRLNKLYHPSAMDVYKEPVKGKDGKYYLNSPMVSSIKNPMAMRSLHQLRKVINELIKTGIIDKNTKVHIEMARDLMNANERKALQSWQRDREAYRKICIEKIRENFNSDYEPSADEILKYQFWEEQNHKCVYTGSEIKLTDFLGASPKFDIEHTLPRSQSMDNSQENKTLCDLKFNREVKRNKIPIELANHTEILPRIEHWKIKYEELNNQIEIQVRRAKGAATKEAKDKAIQARHKLTLERNYWRNKYHRFTQKELTESFKPKLRSKILLWCK